MNLKHKTCNKK